MAAKKGGKKRKERSLVPARKGDREKKSLHHMPRSPRGKGRSMEKKVLVPRRERKGEFPVQGGGGKRADSAKRAGEEKGHELTVSSRNLESRARAKRKKTARKREGRESL